MRLEIAEVQEECDCSIVRQSQHPQRTAAQTLPEGQCLIVLSIQRAFSHLILAFSDEETETHELNHLPKPPSARRDRLAPSNAHNHHAQARLLYDCTAAVFFQKRSLIRPCRCHLFVNSNSPRVFLVIVVIVVLKLQMKNSVSHRV